MPRGKAEQAEVIIPKLREVDIEPMRNMNGAIDEVRRAEVYQLRQDGYEPILTKARWCLLKRHENLNDNQEVS